ncbi:MAG: 1-(5-phosphoribosyl)-5-[(5-phosphoribosylamino)methylideneamino]imidazole-4-carboxamide isomerase [Sedimentisphaerales bacterium]|nr:1-(5-phosphoribosyl)-5-[(5-phosphoribosylamino)methylideneamino]imidazole-4-carboxamide isomerase [Sedimentisphaerales bacterium]
MIFTTDAVESLFMEVIPAIDLCDGRCVRLVQGIYDQRIDYDEDPLAVAHRFFEQGARWLHVVDLDGAKAGRPVNTKAISALAGQGLLRMEVGGGLRDESSIRQMLELGVARVVIGTKAVKDFGWFGRMAELFSGRLVLGLDARSGHVATDGWTQGSDVSALDLAVRASSYPIAAIIYTDIARDGMLTGPNIKQAMAIADAVQVPVICSGGIAIIADIKAVAAAGKIAGVIVGRSLYEGTLDLAEAIAVAAGKEV